MRGTPGYNDARLDATVAPWLLGCFGKGTLRTDPSAFPTLAPRDPALASRHALAPPPYVFAVPQIHANSPGLAHARGKHELPGWFKRALLHTRFVQSKDANGAVGDVVLVEGPQPAGRDFCASSGIVHYAVPQSRHAKYRAVLEQISDATMWSTGEGKHEERGVDVQSSADIWLLSIIRYFYLQDFVHAAGVDRLIYLDWDTVVYISAPAAWRILAAASPPIHMAAGSAYPPYGTANNIYTAWTNESLADYVGYIATHVSLQIPAECKATNGSALGLVNSYSDCLQLFWSYRVFNLNEPFGNGNVLSDSPVEGTRSHGTVHKGFRGELIGVSSALPGDLWETVYTTSPKRSYYLHSKSKLFTWGSSPGLMYCAPYASQRRPHSTNAPMWGWEAFAPSTEVFNTTAHNDTDRRFFRNWAVTFSTPALKERLLPHFLLVDDNGKEVPCRSMRGGVELYERPTHAHAHAHPGTNHTRSEHPHAAAEVEETRGEIQTST